MDGGDFIPDFVNSLGVVLSGLAALSLVVSQFLLSAFVDLGCHVMISFAAVTYLDTVHSARAALALSD